MKRKCVLGTEAAGVGIFFHIHETIMNKYEYMYM